MFEEIQGRIRAIGGVEIWQILCFDELLTCSDEDRFAFVPQWQNRGILRHQGKSRYLGGHASISVVESVKA